MNFIEEIKNTLVRQASVNNYASKHVF